MTFASTIESTFDMERVYSELAQALLSASQQARGKVHAQDNDQMMFELNHITLVWNVSSRLFEWQKVVRPNLPWAEDHFNERISGEPLNPPPSASWWPFNQNDNEVHKKNKQFSHTYPERFWPKWAAGGHPNDMTTYEHHGIRFPYGDLADLIEVLRNDPTTRQAYLPVWFPEDLHASLIGERVPCTLGYHFLQTEAHTIDCTYFLRSCDIVRFFRDDVYMAGRLLHYVCSQTGFVPGNLIMHISNLHAFEGDRFFLNQQLPQEERQFPTETISDKRSRYNFDGMM